MPKKRCFEAIVIDNDADDDKELEKFLTSSV
jgi:hypothetical protein